MLKVCQRPELIQQLQHGLSFADDATVNNALLVKYSLWDYLTPCDADNINILNACIQRWREEANKLYETTLFTYNPIENYDMEEKGQDKRTPNLTDETTLGSAQTRSSAGYNSPRVLLNDAKVEGSGKDTVKHTGTDTKDHELRRHGNIGVTTTQQMIEMERKIILDTLSWYVEKFAECFTVSMSIADYDCCGMDIPSCRPERSDSDIQDEINHINTEIGLLQEGVATLNAAVQDLDGRVDTLEGCCEDVRGDIENLQENKADIMMLSASGSILNISDAAVGPLIKCVSSIKAVQNGVPDPFTPVPIMGAGEVSVSATGVNIWDEDWVTGIINASGIYVSSGNRVVSNTYIPVKAGSTYYVTNGIAWIYYYSEANVGGFINNAAPPSDRLITIPANARYIKFYTSADYGSTYNNDLGIIYQASSYSPHLGASFNISWYLDVGYVYGGDINLTTGELTVTHGNIVSYAGETINEPWLSSMDVYTPGGTPTTGAQVVYPLTTPITYTLPTNAHVSTIEGITHIFSTTGDLNIVYFPPSYNDLLDFITHQ